MDVAVGIPTTKASATRHDKRNVEFDAERGGSDKLCD